MSSQDLDKYSGLQRILAASFYSYETLIMLTVMMDIVLLQCRDSENMIRESVTKQPYKQGTTVQYSTVQHHLHINSKNPFCIYLGLAGAVNGQRSC